MSDCRLTTFDNPYDPFEQFALWMLFDNRNGYNTCGKIDRLTHYSDPAPSRVAPDFFTISISPRRAQPFARKSSIRST